MDKAKFWFVQIAMVTALSFVFGSPVFAAKGEVTAASDETTHGEEMRMENANMDNDSADWKTPVVPDPEECPDGTEGDYPECTPVDPPEDCVPDFTTKCP